MDRHTVVLEQSKIRTPKTVRRLKLAFVCRGFALNRLRGKGGPFNVARAYAMLSEIELSPAY